MMADLDWLANVIVGALGFAGGFYSAIHAQDRADAKRLRNAAGALREEVERLREELLEWSGDLRGILHRELPEPRVHPWVHGLVAETAAAAPLVIGRLLRVDVALSSRPSLTESVRSAHRRLASMELSLENAATDSRFTMYSIPDLQRMESDARHAFELSRSALATQDAMLLRELEVVHSALTALILRPLPRAWPSAGELSPQAWGTPTGR
jgi:hypothetical protein